MPSFMKIKKVLKNDFYPLFWENGVGPTEMFSSPIPKRIELEQWDCPQMEALSSGPRIFFYFDVLEKFLRILVVRFFSFCILLW